MDGTDFDPATGEIVDARAAMPSMPPAIAAAIIAVKKQVKQLGADDKNEHGRYNFVSIDKFYERIGKLMAEAGLALLIDETETDVRGSDKTGNPWLFAQYNLVFLHESGAMSGALRRSIALPISGPQAFGAAQSYIEKQFLRQVFKVPTGDKDADDTKPSDGDAPASATGGRTAQGGAPAATAGRGRAQAAPAPSGDRAEAMRQQRALASDVDASITVIELETIAGSLAWETLDMLVHRVEEKDVADRLMEGLRNRIAKRREMLLPAAGYGYEEGR